MGMKKVAAICKIYIYNHTEAWLSQRCVQIILDIESED